MAFSKYNTNRFKAEPPVKEGEVYDVEILSIGEKGDGIAKVQGFVIVVPGTKKGDKVKVKVNAVRGKVSFGEVVGASEGQPAEAGEEAGAGSQEESGDFEAGEGAGGEDEETEEEADAGEGNDEFEAEEGN
ncbi:MAG: TRAM domain-containing protein [Candidatus Diapherotrites archaeon]|uniref:TRAM domain-containing protein n=1 Tax=Candidatus Iainarchaeum sp. TaxID=3101447 RepID=A0A8T4L9K0_9ARCH|nr:TRAM domain-containing protein [Candidatus Diapherotrites archaeon]